MITVSQLKIWRMHPGAVAVFALSLATHLAFFSRPAEVVFDEIHIGKYVAATADRLYHFDVHPPLGRLLIAATGARVAPRYHFEKIGDRYPDRGYLLLRLLPTLAGIFLPLIIYLLAIELSLSKGAATFAGLAVVLDNAILVHSRLMLTDTMLILAGFAALYFYFKHRRTGAWRHAIFMGLCSGAAVSIKWTGLSFVALPLFVEFIIVCQKRTIQPSWKILACGLAIPVTMYVLVGITYLAVFTKSGPGDAFMSREFQHTLAGNPLAADPSIRSLNIAAKFIELQKAMMNANHTLNTPHDYGSRWYTWPIMFRPIYYWAHNNAAHIYFLGNPVIWWLSTLAMIVVAGGLVWLPPPRRNVLAFILVGYLANLLPFVGIERITFLYHYLPAYSFAILGLAAVLDIKNQVRDLGAAIIVLALAAFIFFAPLTYGLPLSPSALQQRMWLPTWR